MDKLATQAKIRNVLIEAIGRRGQAAQLREAALRVTRLSDPGTPERLLTLIAISEETGIKSGDIVNEIQRVKSREGGK